MRHDEGNRVGFHIAMKDKMRYRITRRINKLHPFHERDANAMIIGGFVEEAEGDMKEQVGLLEFLQCSLARPLWHSIVAD